MGGPSRSAAAAATGAAASATSAAAASSTTTSAATTATAAASGRGPGRDRHRGSGFRRSRDNGAAWDRAGTGASSVDAVTNSGSTVDDGLELGRRARLRDAGLDGGIQGGLLLAMALKVDAAAADVGRAVDEALLCADGDGGERHGGAGFAGGAGAGCEEHHQQLGC